MMDGTQCIVILIVQLAMDLQQHVLLAMLDYYSMMDFAQLGANQMSTVMEHNVLIVILIMPLAMDLQQHVLLAMLDYY